MSNSIGASGGKRESLRQSLGTHAPALAEWSPGSRAQPLDGIRSPWRQRFTRLPQPSLAHFWQAARGKSLRSHP